MSQFLHRYFGIPTSTSSQTGSKQRQRVWSWIELGCILALVALFLGTAGLKIWEPTDDIRRLLLATFEVPLRLGKLIQFWTPWLELTLGFGLLHRRLRPQAALGSILLCLVMIAIIAQAWRIGYTGSCGCFGNRGPVVGTCQKSPERRGVSLVPTSLSPATGH